MKRRLPAIEEELGHRIDEVLHYLWDPIGVSARPHARDEYNAYSTHVFSILLRGCSCREIADYLTSIEKDYMDLAISDQSRANAKAVADILIDWKKYLEEQIQL